ncbi:hypothetical protein VTN31DRAFT_6295 [Thermomyces dupontii]|uniref:uncharacterized protein n=1 Tax=Talaromyces thermophilus TaxID=28565 RepID=UPI003743EF0E
MRPPLRIAVLECDTPLPNTHAKYGGYGGVFESLLRESAKKLADDNEPYQLDPDRDLQISKWDVVNDDKYPKLEDIDAILISGSKHNAFDDHPWIIRLVEYTKQVYAHDRARIIGVCFGHQIVGRALGAPVGRSEAGWEISVCDVDLTDKGKELFGKDKLSLQQMHRDIVKDYPKEVIPLASSPRCSVQGMYIPRRLITLQGHPEFTEEIVSEILTTRNKLRVFSDEECQEALSRVKNKHDGLVAGAAFLRFLLEE